MVASHENHQTTENVEIIGVLHTDVVELADIQPTLNRLHDAECVLVEAVGGTPEQRVEMTELYNAVSEGLVKASVLDELAVGRDNYIFHLIAGLAGSGKLILLIDTAADPADPIWLALQRTDELKRQLTDDTLDGVQTLKMLAELRELQTLTLWNRDARMAEQILDVDTRLETLYKEPQNIKVIVGNDHVEGVNHALSYLRDEQAA